MNRLHLYWIAALLPALLLACADRVRAQEPAAFPGLVTIPDEDFIWVWGSMEGARQALAPHLTMSGEDGVFDCVMTVRLVVSHRLTDTERSQLERDVDRNASFIRGAVDAINFLHQRRDVDWARLRCERVADSEAAIRRNDSIIDERLRRRSRPVR